MAGNTESIIYCRGICNENGVSDGFWSDSGNLYKYATMAQRACITAGINYVRELSKSVPADKFKEPFYLQVLHTVKTFNLGSGISYYDFATMSVTDFLYPVSLELDLTGIGTKRAATLIDEVVRIIRKASSYAGGTVRFPLFSISDDTINMDPAPSANVTNGARLIYYADPPEVTSSQDITLKSPAWNAIAYYMAYLAKKQDSQPDAKEMLEMYKLELAGLF